MEPPSFLWGKIRHTSPLLLEWALLDLACGGGKVLVQRTILLAAVLLVNRCIILC